MNTLRITMLAALVDQSATFVFLLSDRLYGLAIAFGSGSQADRYHIIRALAVTLLKALVPELRPLLEVPVYRPGSEPRVVAFDNHR